MEGGVKKSTTFVYPEVVHNHYAYHDVIDNHNAKNDHQYLTLQKKVEPSFCYFSCMVPVSVFGILSLSSLFCGSAGSKCAIHCHCCHFVVACCCCCGLLPIILTFSLYHFFKKAPGPPLVRCEELIRVKLNCDTSCPNNSKQ